MEVVCGEFSGGWQGFSNRGQLHSHPYSHSHRRVVHSSGNIVEHICIKDHDPARHKDEVNAFVDYGRTVEEGL
jgi:hypothetical protein